MKNKSSVIAGLMLQSLITRAVELRMTLASIGLSEAFDIVNVKLVIKPLVNLLFEVVLCAPHLFLTVKKVNTINKI